jgi:ABC-type polysaccharide/polyol phosphate export permease
MKKNNSLFKVIINYYDLYYFLSSYDVASRFRSSRLGVLWLVIQQLMFALGISLVWSNVFAIDIYDFVPFLTLGLSL